MRFKPVYTLTAAQEDERRARQTAIVNARLPEQKPAIHDARFEALFSLKTLDLERSRMLAERFPQSARNCHTVWESTARQDPGFVRRFPTARHFQTFVGELRIQAGYAHE